MHIRDAWEQAVFALSQNISVEWGQGVLNRSAGTTQSSWCFTMNATWNLSDPMVRSFALTKSFGQTSQ